MAGSRRPAPAGAALDATVAIGVGILAVVAIRPTLLPGVGYWDTAEAQVVGPLLGTMHPTGFPAYVILGWVASAILQPLGEPAFRMNLLSALLVGAAAAGSVVVARQLRVPLPIAGAAGLGLAATPIVWKIGTSADAHALHLALVVLLVAVLLAWERRVVGGREALGHGGPAESHAARLLIVAAAVFGVSLANHSLTLLLAPAVGLYVVAVGGRSVLRPRTVIAACLALFGTAALLYLELPLRAGPFPAPIVYGRPDTWDGFRYVVLAEQFRGSIVDPFGEPVRKLAALVTLAAEQLGVLAILVPAAFLATVRRAPRYALLSGLASLLTCFFAASYVNADIGRYYLGPAFLAWTWLAVLGGFVAESLSTGVPAAGRRAADALTGPSAAPVTAGLLALIMLVPTGVALPERAGLLDRSRDRMAAVWLDEALSTFEPHAVVLSWWSLSTPLWYGQLVEGRRPDIWIVDDRTRLDLQLGDLANVIDANLATRPVYVIRNSDQELAALGRRYDLQPMVRPVGVYRVLGPRDAQG